MGLMDKFKNLFTDEEIIEDDDEEILDDEVEIKEVKNVKKKEENKLPTFMREKIAKEEGDKKEESVSDFSISREIKINDSNLGDSVNNSNNIGSSFKFPIEFEENDFPSRSSRHVNNTKIEKSVNDNDKIVSRKKVEVKPKSDKKVADLYKDKKKEAPKTFRATPIISPIYGVLDKNYKTDDLKSNESDNYEVSRPSKTIDFDSVRKKAYGEKKEVEFDNSICDNCEYLKKAKSCKKDSNDDNLMYDALCEKDENIDEIDDNDITLDEATENYYDYGVEYRKKPLDKVSDDSLLDKNVDIFDEEKVNKKIPPVKSSINLLSTLKKSMGDDEKKEDTELTADLYNLIDSMYDEGDEK